MRHTCPGHGASHQVPKRVEIRFGSRSVSLAWSFVSSFAELNRSRSRGLAAFGGRFLQGQLKELKDSSEMPTTEVKSRMKAFIKPLDHMQALRRPFFRTKQRNPMNTWISSPHHRNVLFSGFVACSDHFGEPGAGLGPVLWYGRKAPTLNTE